MGKSLEQRDGAPDLMIHRARLHSALTILTPPHCIHFGKKLIAIEHGASSATLVFADGTRHDARVVIGPDGIHSVVREALFGAEQPRFTGRVAHRTTYPTVRINGIAIDERANGGVQTVMWCITSRLRARTRSTSLPLRPSRISTLNPGRRGGDKDTLLTAFSGFHPSVRTILAAAPEVRKWALVERDPMPSWGENCIVLLGDACHPMLPYMAQGAASAIEDAVVLARCLDRLASDDICSALAVYAASRKERTDRIQLTNRRE
jgi:salicylate hydroxylase/6-hydroxynicotinate 3-monooxygenase